MKITISKQNPDRYSGDMLVYCICEQSGKSLPIVNHPELKKILKVAFQTGDFEAKEGQVFMTYSPLLKNGKGTQRVLAVGLGKNPLDCEALRKCGGTIAKGVQNTQAKKIMVVLPEFLDIPTLQISESITEGLVLGNYHFNKYKNPPKEGKKPNYITQVTFAAKNDRLARKGMQKGLCASQAVCAARDMANEPGNKWTTDNFATYSLSLSKQYGIKRTVFTHKELKRLKMGGLLGVNQGSSIPAKMIILEYRTGKKVPTLMLVGKGLTFDSGGISIKPSNGMQDMKYDMCGGAAVLACMQAVGQEKPKHIDVIAIVPATDNMPGPSALKPGDIITHYNGKTVEVINTDAEGRLILADALSYGVKKYMPDAVIDIATLTGAVIVGLGHHHSGLLSNDDALSDKIIQSATKSGEPAWRLPLTKEYTKQLESKVADLKNVADQGGGTITAGAFLQEFVGETKWAHLDIAGTAWGFTEKSYIPKGPSGVGVRLLLDLVRSW